MQWEGFIKKILFLLPTMMIDFLSPLFYNRISLFFHNLRGSHKVL